MIKFILICALSCSVYFVHAQSSKTSWAVGPMIHLYFGKPPHSSFGLEISAWRDGYSIDLGIDAINENRYWVYSEFQTTIHSPNNSAINIPLGISIGPCLEIRNDSLSYIHFGIQGSGWGVFFLGFDARARWMQDSFTISGGAFFKIPIQGYFSQVWE